MPLDRQNISTKQITHFLAPLGLVLLIVCIPEDIIANRLGKKSRKNHDESFVRFLINYLPLLHPKAISDLGSLSFCFFSFLLSFTTKKTYTMAMKITPEAIEYKTTYPRGFLIKVPKGNPTMKPIGIKLSRTESLLVLNSGVVISTM